MLTGFEIAFVVSAYTAICCRRSKGCLLLNWTKQLTTLLAAKPEELPVRVVFNTIVKITACVTKQRACRTLRSYLQRVLPKYPNTNHAAIGPIPTLASRFLLLEQHGVTQGDCEYYIYTGDS